MNLRMARNSLEALTIGPDVVLATVTQAIPAESLERSLEFPSLQLPIVHLYVYVKLAIPV